MPRCNDRISKIISDKIEWKIVQGALNYEYALYWLWSYSYSVICVQLTGSAWAVGTIFIRKGKISFLGDKINGIPPVVECYWKNRRYIIARQHPEWPPEAIYGTVDYHHGYGMDYYWIIDKTNDSVQGPLDSATFYRYIHMKGIDYKLK